MNASRLLPILDTLRGYSRAAATQDALAALIVTVLLIPQSLAYAMLAGLPPVVGLYASILPTVGYALFGSSSSLAVGPVAIVALMTAAALGPLFAAGSPEYLAAALLLSLLSGLVLLVMAALRLGFLANFLSHPVISGFVSASALLILISQLGPLLGIATTGTTAPQLLVSLAHGLPTWHGPTLSVALSSIGLLWLFRARAARWLTALGLSARRADGLARMGPVLVVVLALAASAALDLAAAGVAVLGALPTGLPPLTRPPLEPELIARLVPAAVLIALVGFVGSISIAHTFAARRRQQVDPNRELAGLGAANIAAAFFGGLPVTGGFSRSAINFDAGARTPVAGLFTAAGFALAAVLLTAYLTALPRAVLSAIIVVSVLGLVDFRAFRRSWRFSRRDFAAQAATFAGVLLIGVEAGIAFGVGVSLSLFLWRTSRPHIAVVGLLPGSEHFRNVERFEVIESPTVLTLRIDESLYFPNVRYLEERILELVAARPAVRHLVLMCPGVNWIDASALDSLETIAGRLCEAGVQLHMSEVKGPVMDQLRRSELIGRLGGRVFVSQYQALLALDPATAARAKQRL